VCRHAELYWNFFESGHGKGPSGELGGTAKRQAAEAVKQGKVNIQDAAEFYQWGTQNQKSIMYRFYRQNLKQKKSYVALVIQFRREDPNDSSKSVTQMLTQLKSAPKSNLNKIRYV